MRIALAYSGGLDTTYCVAWLTREMSADVVTVTVDTGGLDAEEAARIADRARSAGAVEHHLVDARQKVWDNFIATLIRGTSLVPRSRSWRRRMGRTWCEPRFPESSTAVPG